MQDYPPGYPLQAAFQSSEPGWSIYRSFDYLHSRVILQLQDQVFALERELADQDKENLENGDHDLLEHRRKQNDEYTALLEKIRCKLLQYGEFSALTLEAGG